MGLSVTGLVRYEIDGHVVLITMDRPERRNAENVELVEAREEAMGMRESMEFHFLLHQLRHAGLGDGWLRPSAATGAPRSLLHQMVATRRDAEREDQ
jgi:hypothetical protein